MCECVCVCVHITLAEVLVQCVHVQLTHMLRVCGYEMIRANKTTHRIITNCALCAR